jgi:type IV pilus assembly protein PilQ
VELVSDQPFTYTTYKSGEPAKIVIDISQTEPGPVATSIQVNRGNIRHIELVRQKVGPGVLTRAEIYLAKDVDFTAATDPSDKKKLDITLLSLESEAKPAQLEGKELPLSENKIVEKNLVGEASPGLPSPLSPTTLAVPVGAPLTAEAAGKSTGSKSALNAVLLASDGVELSIEGGVQTFNAFKLAKPDRIVVDLFGLKDLLSQNVVPIGQFGVGSVRVGSTPDKVRVVLDAARETLPPFEVVKSNLGVKIRFKVATAGGGAYAHPSPAVPAPAPVGGAAAVGHTLPAAATAEVPIEVPPSPHTKGALESLDFHVVNGVSRITVRLFGTCEATEPILVRQGLSVMINNCQVPKRLQRALDTAQSGSPVLSVTSYQLKVNGAPVAKVLLKLRGNPAFTMNRQGNILVLDVENPGPLPQPKLPPAPVVTANTLPEPRITEELAPVKSSEVVTEVPRDGRQRHAGRKVYTGRRVTLEFSDADVRKIFQLIAEVSKLNFLIADDVTGTLSIKLVNVPWDQALDVILEAKGLGMQQDGNIVLIKPKSMIQTQAQEDLKTEVFEVNYAAVKDVVEQFTELKSKWGKITKDDRTSRVIVKDVQTVLDDMRHLLKILDTPERQVMIEARIVEASSDFTRDLGVQWSMNYNDGTASVAGINSASSTFGGVVSPTGPGTSGTGGLGLGMSFGKLTSNIQLDMRLAASATIGQVKVISTPKVMTLNNKAAKISQGQSIPYQTTSAAGTQTEFVEAALTLEVTPHITANGSVSMKIKASNNSPGTGSPPPINKKEATTELVVANGETTVIGGIYVDSDTDSDTGVPFLSDIPLLGWLFKSNSKEKTKTELLIFITPKIVAN